MLPRIFINPKQLPIRIKIYPISGDIANENLLIYVKQG